MMRGQMARGAASGRSDGAGGVARLPARAPSAPPSRTSGGKRNHSVRKAIALLRAAGADGASSVSALARAAGVPRATALRLVMTMEDEGFLVRVGDGDRVVLGPDLIQLVRGADESGAVMELAREPLRELGEQVRETVTLSVVARDGQLDIVDQVDAPHQIRPGDWVGQRFPMHASSTGKILLASFDDARLDEVLSQPLARLTPATITQPKRLRDELARVRRRRYATTIDELEEGLSGVSVGVLAPGGSLVAVVNVTGPTQRLRRARLAEIAPTLRAFAERLESKLRPRT
jgi:DNA-binding IclR family transcriptional regulator